ncbi:hypothetical protein RhiXN_05658 [Rhizoctonia solani]|uniref:Uncharacterized protein n=1 Tax=Rhizoctonia solani TaxID=456999 RepID=A0A8H8SWS5_9AGAM|nr:uncharacterized protein RhiXN_05658 [Rhizoctonia solani]QRW20669.1 hypothetical protein RhiXN_05658 [Rhizoctonia solani]
MFSKIFSRAQPQTHKLPVRPLRLPHVVAAHERHHSTIIMQTMTSRALYAQTDEGHTPAWKEFQPTRGTDIWASFIASLSTIVTWALSTLTRRNSLHSSSNNNTATLPKNKSLRNDEDLIRRALEQTGTRTVRFYDEKLECHDFHPGHIQRHESIVELSPRSLGAAGWTAAARGAHARTEIPSPPMAR